MQPDAAKVDSHSETLRSWVRQAENDSGAHIRQLGSCVDHERTANPIARRNTNQRRGIQHQVGAEM